MTPAGLMMAEALMAWRQRVLVSVAQEEEFMEAMVRIGWAVLDGATWRRTMRVGGRSTSIMPPADGK